MFSPKPVRIGSARSRGRTRSESQMIHFTPRQFGVATFYCDTQLLFFKNHRERGQIGCLEVR
jgi:hypothetical protein